MCFIAKEGNSVEHEAEVRHVSVYQFKAVYVKAPHATDLVQLPNIPSLCESDRAPASRAASLKRLKDGGIQMLQTFLSECKKLLRSSILLEKFVSLTKICSNSLVMSKARVVSHSRMSPLDHPAIKCDLLVLDQATMRKSTDFKFCNYFDRVVITF